MPHRSTDMADSGDDDLGMPDDSCFGVVILPPSLHAGSRAAVPGDSDTDTSDAVALPVAAATADARRSKPARVRVRKPRPSRSAPAGGADTGAPDTAGTGAGTAAPARKGDDDTSSGASAPHPAPDAQASWPSANGVTSPVRGATATDASPVPAPSGDDHRQQKKERKEKKKKKKKQDTNHEGQTKHADTADASSATLAAVADPISAVTSRPRSKSRPRPPRPKRRPPSATPGSIDANATSIAHDSDDASMDSLATPSTASVGTPTPNGLDSDTGDGDGGASGGGSAVPVAPAFHGDDDPDRFTLSTTPSVLARRTETTPADDYSLVLYQRPYTQGAWIGNLAFWGRTQITPPESSMVRFLHRYRTDLLRSGHPMPRLRVVTEAHHCTEPVIQYGLGVMTVDSTCVMEVLAFLFFMRVASRRTAACVVRPQSEYVRALEQTMQTSKAVPPRPEPKQPALHPHAPTLHGSKPKRVRFADPVADTHQKQQQTVTSPALMRAEPARVFQFCVSLLPLGHNARLYRLMRVLLDDTSIAELFDRDHGQQIMQLHNPSSQADLYHVHELVRHLLRSTGDPDAIELAQNNLIPYTSVFVAVFDRMYPPEAFQTFPLS